MLGELPLLIYSLAETSFEPKRKTGKNAVNQ
jgi:hypothetical protein